MSYDADFRQAAAEMLGLIADDGFGQAVVVTSPESGGTYDPATGTMSGASAVQQTGSGVVLEYSTFIRSGVRAEANSLIQAGDRQLLLSPLQGDGSALTAPQVGWTAQIAGVTYTITSIAPQAPAGTVIYYECNIRGAA